MDSDRAVNGGTPSRATWLSDLRSIVVLGLLAMALGAGLGAVVSSVSLSDVSNQVFWYVSRAAGLTAYLMLFVNMVLGLAVKTKVLNSLLARWRSFDLHQFTALLALGLLALHVFSLLGDQFVGFSVPQLFVPFASSYRPLPVTLGIIALYALAVITVTFYIRDRIGQKAWRSIHYVSFVAFYVALLHGVYSGTDSVEVWAKLMYFASGLVVALLTTWRFLEAGKPVPEKQARRAPIGATDPGGRR